MLRQLSCLFVMYFEFKVRALSCNSHCCLNHSKLQCRDEPAHANACAQLEMTAMTFPLACMMGMYVAHSFFLLHFGYQAYLYFTAFQLRGCHVHVDDDHDSFRSSNLLLDQFTPCLIFLRNYYCRSVCLCTQQSAALGLHSQARDSCIRWPACHAVAVSLESDILSFFWKFTKINYLSRCLMQIQSIPPVTDSHSGSCICSRPQTSFVSGPSEQPKLTLTMCSCSWLLLLHDS